MDISWPERIACCLPYTLRAPSNWCVFGYVPCRRWSGASAEERGDICMDTPITPPSKDKNMSNIELQNINPNHLSIKLVFYGIFVHFLGFQGQSQSPKNPTPAPHRKRLRGAVGTFRHGRGRLQFGPKMVTEPFQEVTPWIILLPRMQSSPATLSHVNEPSFDTGTLAWGDNLSYI